MPAKKLLPPGDLCFDNPPLSIYLHVRQDHAADSFRPANALDKAEQAAYRNRLLRVACALAEDAAASVKTKNTAIVRSLTHSR